MTKQTRIYGFRGEFCNHFQYICVPPVRGGGGGVGGSGPAPGLLTYKPFDAPETIKKSRYVHGFRDEVRNHIQDIWVPPVRGGGGSGPAPGLLTYKPFDAPETIKKSIHVYGFRGDLHAS